LYATGFFKDVQIEVQGNVLIIVLEERPSVALVEFTGMKEFEKDVLIKALKKLVLVKVVFLIKHRLIAQNKN